MKKPPKIAVHTMSASMCLVYVPEVLEVSSDLNRFVIGSRVPFRHRPGGSLDLYFQQPCADGRYPAISKCP